MPLRCSLRTAGVTWGMAWSEDCCIERWSRCARALAAVCVRARSAVGCLARRVRQRSSWVRAFTQNAHKNFFSIFIIPSASCACAGASLIYPKLDYTLLLLPILYCVNRAPPENRMIMRFLPFHFCNPLQTDVNRLQSDAFRVQLDAFRRHFVASRMQSDARRMRWGICRT